MTETIRRPIHILHVVDGLGWAGLQNGMRNLTERLDADRFAHSICALHRLDESQWQEHYFPADRVKVIYLDDDAANLRVKIAPLARIIRTIKPDIVHSRNWGTIETVMAARWVRSCAVVHSEHGIDPEIAEEEPWRRIAFRRAAFELADRVLAVSYSLRDHHAKRTGFAASKIGVIHNGVNTQRFFPDAALRARLRRELRISDAELCIGCVGNLTRVKDHMTVLRAASRLSESCMNWRLIMIGEGPERSRLSQFLDGHPAWKDRVTFLGQSSRVAELLNAMDVYVLSSTTEGICNSLLEAMATRLPVVVTAAGGNTEVVVAGESGLLFPVGDDRQLAETLRLLNGRRDVKIELGRQALERVREQFSLGAMVSQYEQLYVSVAAPPSKIPLMAEIRM